MYGVHLFKHAECTPRMNPSVNYELWMKMVCQGGFIDCNKCITLVWDIDIGGCVFWGGSGGACATW